MRIFRQIIIVIILLAAQFAMGRLISIGQIQPNLLAIFVVYWLCRLGPRNGIWIGFTIGIVQDLVTTQYIGISSLSYVIMCFIIGKLSSIWPSNSRLAWIGWLFGGMILYGIIYFYFYATGSYLSFGRLFWNFAIPVAIYTTVLGAIWSITPLWKRGIRRS